MGRSSPDAGEDARRQLDLQPLRHASQTPTWNATAIRIATHQRTGIDEPHQHEQQRHRAGDEADGSKPRRRRRSSATTSSTLGQRVPAQSEASAGPPETRPGRRRERASAHIRMPTQ